MKFLKTVKISIIDIVVLSAILLNIFNYFLFEKTLVPLQIIAFLFAIGIFGYILFKDSTFFKGIGKLESLFYNIIISGSYLTFVFLSLNYFLGSSNTTVSSYKVKCKVNKIWHPENNLDAPTVVKAEFENGFNKRIGLSKEFKINRIHPDSLDIHLSAGYFGFPIIKKVEFRKLSKKFNLVTK
jgi:hypothetical protein